MLQCLNLTSTCGIRGTGNAGEAIHPTIVAEAVRAGEEAPAVLERAIEQGWTAKQVRAEVNGSGGLGLRRSRRAASM